MRKINGKLFLYELKKTFLLHFSAKEAVTLLPRIKKLNFICRQKAAAMNSEL